MELGINGGVYNWECRIVTYDSTCRNALLALKSALHGMTYPVYELPVSRMVYLVGFVGEW
jgi:hypothetical protein